MDEFRTSSESMSETDDRREVIKQKLRQYYDGCVVRKDLTKSIRKETNFFYNMSNNQVGLVGLWDVVPK